MKSVYSDTYHVAIPTLEYLKAVTGFDMVVEGGWTKEVTESKVLSLSLRARDYLMTNRSARYQNALSYLIKFDDTWREAWDNFVAHYIGIAHSVMVMKHHGKKHRWKLSMRLRDHYWHNIDSPTTHIIRLNKVVKRGENIYRLVVGIQKLCKP